MSAGAYQPDSQIPSMAQLPTSGEAQPRQRVFSAAGAVTYNQQLTMQHAALVAALAGVECSTPHAGNAATSGSGEQVSSNGIDNSIGAEGIAWRADAAIIPDEGLASADVYAPPNTPSAGALTPGDTLGGSRYDSINYPGLSPGLSSIFEGVAHGSPSSSGSMTLGRADTSEDLSLTSNSSVLDRTRSDPTSAVAAVDGLREAVAVMRSEASAVDLTAPEAAAMVSRIAGRLSRPLSDRVVQDLLRLARYKLLGPGVSGGKLERVPASVLATTQAARPGSAVRSVEDAAAATRPAANQLLATALSNPKEAMGSRSGAGATDVDGLDGSEDVILFVGLIDWLQPYNMRKKVEHRVKSVVQDAKGISVQEPKTYSRRFLGFMEKVFVA